MTRDTKQLNIEIDAELLARFTEALRIHGKSKREVVETLIDVWMVTKEARGARHLDGSECPLATFLATLADQVKAMLPGSPEPIPLPLFANTIEPDAISMSGASPI